MKINLVKNGIFPIRYDKNGEEINRGCNVGTIQGEGKFLGTPSLFIRFSGCNLRCAWKDKDGNITLCDTPYASFSPEKNQMEVDDIVETVVRNLLGTKINHIVITGGEPLIQGQQLIELCKQLCEYDFIITIETNGTSILQGLYKYVDLFSISPKLFNSIPSKDKLGENYSETLESKHIEERINRSIIKQYFIAKGNFNVQLKFVVNDINDFKEIDDIVDDIPFCNQRDVYIMPEGLTEDRLNSRNWIIDECIKRGYNFTPRLHINLYGNDRNR